MDFLVQLNNGKAVLPANHIAFIITVEISDKLVIKGSIKKPMSLSRLGMVLQQQGFKSKRINHGKIRGWLVEELGAEEINANRRIYGKEIDQ